MKLEIENVTKTYGDVLALDHFSITLQEGIYGVLGPNGAGKTTLMNILCLLLDMDEGSIKLNDIRIQQQKSTYLDILGYMPQYAQLYEDFTLEEYLYYIGALKGMRKQLIEKRVTQLLKDVELQEKRKVKLKTFSGGMKQRTMFAQALLNDPKIVILDEPTAGLDPKQRIKLRNLVARMSKDRIVLVSTHVVSDVEFISNKIILIKKGKCIAIDRPTNLQKGLEGHTKIIEVKEQDVESLQETYYVSNLFYEQSTLYARIVVKDHRSVEGSAVFPTLEDVYLYHFGEDDETI